MRSSKIIFAAITSLLALACGGSADPGVLGGGASSSGGDAGASSSSGGGAKADAGKKTGGGGDSNGGSGSGGVGTGDGSGGTGGSGGGSGGKRVFVTSVTYTGNLGGVSGADAKCQTAADAQLLGGTWTAWISSGSTNAIDRIADVGPWYLVDGTKAFNNKANLLTTPLVTVDVDEAGNFPTWLGLDATWTGSAEGGLASGADCNGWTDASNGVGSTGSMSASQTWGGSSSGPLQCNVNEGLICFEQ